MAVDTLTFSVVTVIYLLLIMGLGFLGYRQTKEHEDYMIAGRKIHPVILALSYGATFISTSAIVGFGGVAAQLGMGLIWLTVLNIGIGIFITFVIFGKKNKTNWAFPEGSDISGSDGQTLQFAFYAVRYRTDHRRRYASLYCGDPYRRCAVHHQHADDTI